jgi:hypothetical protein
LVQVVEDEKYCVPIGVEPPLVMAIAEEFIHQPSKRREEKWERGPRGKTVHEKEYIMMLQYPLSINIQNMEMITTLR